MDKVDWFDFWHRKFDDPKIQDVAWNILCWDRRCRDLVFTIFDDLEGTRLVLKDSRKVIASLEKLNAKLSEEVDGFTRENVRLREALKAANDRIEFLTNPAPLSCHYGHEPLDTKVFNLGEFCKELDGRVRKLEDR